jgi:hypothetical protein
MNSDVAAILIDLVEVQTSVEDSRIGISEGAFQRAGVLRELQKRWVGSGPHAAEWTKEFGDRAQATLTTIERTVALMKENHVMRRERNQVLLASSRTLEQSQDRDPSFLIREMLEAYRRELNVDLPPIIELFQNLDRQMSDLEEFVSSCLQSENDGPLTKRFKRKNNG